MSDIKSAIQPPQKQDGGCNVEHVRHWRYYIVDKGSMEVLIPSKQAQDSTDGGFFSRPEEKDEEATEPEWVPLTWRSKLPRSPLLSLLIPGTTR